MVFVRSHEAAGAYAAVDRLHQWFPGVITPNLVRLRHLLSSWTSYGSVSRPHATVIRFYNTRGRRVATQARMGVTTQRPPSCLSTFSCQFVVSLCIAARVLERGMTIDITKSFSDWCGSHFNLARWAEFGPWGHRTNSVFVSYLDGRTSRAL